MYHVARITALVIAVFACYLPPASVRAVPLPQQTFTFSGSCTDCAQVQGAPNPYPVTATLVLEGYTLGSFIQLADFVSFSYGGSNLISPFTILNSDLTDSSNTSWSVGGIIPSSLPSAADFGVGFTRTGASLGFQSLANGGWCAGTFACLDDYGTNGTWNDGSGGTGGSQVPEPGALELAALGLAIVLATRSHSARRT